MSVGVGRHHIKINNMGSEINVRELSMSKNDRDSMPSHSKLLTLPTILTLGRVAAIPLLVASVFHFLFHSHNLSISNWCDSNCFFIMPLFIFVQIYIHACGFLIPTMLYLFVQIILLSLLHGWLARNNCYHKYFHRCSNYRLAWWLSCPQGTYLPTLDYSNCFSSLTLYMLLYLASFPNLQLITFIY